MKTANRTNPTLIKVTSNGQTIGHLTTAEFRKYMDCPSRLFLQELIQRFNENKTSMGEPERVEQVINAA